MKAINGWENIEAQGSEDFKRLVPGGYVCRITAVQDVPSKNHLAIEFDIAEGEFKGYGASFLERNGFTVLKMRKYYNTNRDESDPDYEQKQKQIASMFKGFINDVEMSNPNYKWNFDEKTLVGKLIGVVLGEEEYKKMDGKIGTRWDARTKSVGAIKDGRFKVPEKKTMPVEQTTSSFVVDNSDDSELPF